MNMTLGLTLFLVARLICLVYCREVKADDIGVIRELWSDVPGNSIQNLLADSRFPHKPTIVNFIKTFDAPVEETTTNSENNAQRIKGYFFAPQNGNYKFYSSCGGPCEVFLGLNGLEGEDNRIISQDQPTKHNQFEEYPEQQSRSISLTKGKKYYVEALNKQNGGTDDNLSVGVELPDGKKMFPISERLLRKTKLEKDEDDSESETTNDKTEAPNTSTHNSKTMIQRKHEETKAGVSRALHTKPVQGEMPVLDYEGKKYSDADAVEPGINIFSESNESSDEDKSDEVLQTSSGDSSDEDFSFDDNSLSNATSDDKKSVNQQINQPVDNEQNVLYKDQSEASATNDNVISENINQSVANTLPSMLVQKFFKSSKNSSNVLPSHGDNNERFIKAPDSSEDTPSVENTHAHHYKINPTVSYTKSIDSPSKKERMAHVVPQKQLHSGRVTGDTRSFYDVSEEHEYADHHPEMSMGHGHFEMNPHDIQVDAGPSHLEEPVLNPHNIQVDAGQSHLVEHGLQHTSSVAMVPALLHHDRPEYNHDTGHYEEGVTHVEPLIPVHGAPHHTSITYEHEDAHMGHHGGSMQAPMMHHDGTAAHPTMHEHQDEHHVDPLPMSDLPEKPKHRPNIIKVEFVPDEHTVTASNKSKISSPGKSKGTVRVQFIPGDTADDDTGATRAKSHESKGRTESKVGKSEKLLKSTGSKESTTMTLSPSKNSKQVSLNDLKLSINDGSKAKQSSPEVAKNVKDDNPPPVEGSKFADNDNHGYEVSPKLPAGADIKEATKDLPGNAQMGGGGGRGDNSGYAAGPSNPSFSSYRGTGAAGGDGRTVDAARGGGGGGGGGEDATERVEPALTSLGQQYANSLSFDQKNAIQAEQRASTAQGPDDRVYFGGPSQGSQPDPNPTHGSPDGPAAGGRGPVINPVANHMVQALNTHNVSPEEALQMMNDFVSGNQDMNKAAKNMEGMLSQISSRRHQAENPESNFQPPETPITEAGFSNPETPVDTPDRPSRFVQTPTAMQSQSTEETQHFVDGDSQVNPNLGTGFLNPSLERMKPNVQLPNVVFNNDHQIDSAQQQTEEQFDQSRRPQESANQLSPSPVNLYEGERNAQTRHTTDNLIAEPVKSTYYGFVNPSVPSSAPSLPYGSRHESTQETLNNGESSYLSSNMPSDGSAVSTGASVDLPNTASMSSQGNTDLTVPSTPLGGLPQQSVSNLEPYNDNAGVESPQGHVESGFPAGETSMAYESNTQNYAVKYRVPHEATHVVAKPPDFLHSKFKEQTGNRKHEILADMYADAIFPEDVTDIESLKGSLQGKTLTNFDKTEAELQQVASKKTINRPEVRASFPLEGTILEGSALRSKVPHIKNKNSLKRRFKNTTSNKKKNVSKRKKKYFKKKKSKVTHKTKRRRDVAGITETYLKLSRKRRGRSSMRRRRSINIVEKTQNEVQLKAKKTLNVVQPQVRTNIDTSPSMFPQKTDWADIQPEVVPDKHQTRYIQPESSNARREATSVQLRPETPTDEHGQLRGLVTELKDVLHKLHQIQPSIANRHRHEENSDQSSSFLTNPTVSNLEAISKSDIMSAFSNNIAKPQPIKSVDIESYSQNVWEPGLKGLDNSLYGPGIQYKRGKLPKTRTKS